MFENSKVKAIATLYAEVLTLRIVKAANALELNVLRKRCEVLEGRLAVAFRHSRKIREERDALAKGTSAGEAQRLADEVERLELEVRLLRDVRANGEEAHRKTICELDDMRKQRDEVQRALDNVRAERFGPERDELGKTAVGHGAG